MASLVTSIGNGISTSFKFVAGALVSAKVQTVSVITNYVAARIIVAAGLFTGAVAFGKFALDNGRTLLAARNVEVVTLAVGTEGDADYEAPSTRSTGFCSAINQNRKVAGVFFAQAAGAIVATGAAVFVAVKL